MVYCVRCEVCGEPVNICGGCGMSGVYSNTTTINKWGRPPKTFEQDRDPYKTLEFRRRYWREKRRREAGYNDIDDHLSDEYVKHFQCPYEDCKTWFEVPIELTHKKYKQTYTGQIMCPCCHRNSKIGRAGELEEI